MPKFFFVEGIHDVITCVRFGDDHIAEIAVLNRTAAEFGRRVWLKNSAAAE